MTDVPARAIGAGHDFGALFREQSDVVRLQADGLHVEATNLEFASAIVGIHSEEAGELMIVPFEEATESIVWDIPPGSIQIGCRVDPEVTGAEPADHFLDVEVLPAEG
jgi:hypothetical protein